MYALQFQDNVFALLLSDIMERLHSLKFVCAVHLEYQYPSYHVTCINLERCDKLLSFLFIHSFTSVKALYKEKEN